MEANLKAIIPLTAATGVDLSDQLGCAVGFDGNLGGNAGVIIVDGETDVTVALFGGNAGLVKVKLAGTVAAGEFGVANGSTGKFTKAAVTDVAQVRFVEAGVSTERVSAILLPPAAAVGANVFAAYGHNHDSEYEPLGS